ncbi:MAG TPA: diaminopimelate decarboxylase, partial [Rhodobiaceae bacterium]|nr:diaminopimelate decarboxylase [Rhodobiaceae bacterium]
TLYDAFHEIRAVAEAADAEQMTYDVVGPVCETGDYFAKGRKLPKLGSGDLVAIMSAGAYGAVQASTYNTRPLVPEVMVKGETFEEVRARPSYDAMLKQDIIPSWLD